MKKLLKIQIGLLRSAIGTGQISLFIGLIYLAISIGDLVNGNMIDLMFHCFSLIVNFAVYVFFLKQWSYETYNSGDHKIESMIRKSVDYSFKFGR